MEAVNNPEDESAGTRKVPFSKVLYIERRRLHGRSAAEVLPPGARPRSAPALCLLHHLQGCDQRRRMAKSSSCAASTTRTRAVAPRLTAGASEPLLHWVSAQHAIKAEGPPLRQRFSPWKNPDSDREKDFTSFINPDSLRVVNPIYLEPQLRNARAGDRYQFERLAYFVVDQDSTAEKLVFNRTVTLRDQWRKEQKKAKKPRRKKRRKPSPAP